MMAEFREEMIRRMSALEVRLAQIETRLAEFQAFLAEREARLTRWMLASAGFGGLMGGLVAAVSRLF